METTRNFDYAHFEEQALKELYEGKPLMGEGGIFTPLLKRFLEAGLQGEMDNHLREEQTKSVSNRRNGLSKKGVRSNMGKTWRPHLNWIHPETVQVAMSQASYRNDRRF